MKNLVAKFGILIVVSFFIMAAGIVVFLLSIPLYAYFEIDTDVIGFTIFTLGLAVCIIGIIRRKRLRGWKLVVLAIVAVALLGPVVMLIVTSLYYLVTGNSLGT